MPIGQGSFSFIFAFEKRAFTHTVAVIKKGGGMVMTGKEVMKRANALRDKAVQDRRFLHQNAEVGFDLAKTKKYVWQRLTETGFQPKDCGKAGIIACVGKARKGKKAF